jgi:hypothetical protein
MSRESACQDLFQPVRGLAPESTGHGAQQIQVNGTWSRLVGRPGVEEVLKTARELHAIAAVILWPT